MAPSAMGCPLATVSRFCPHPQLLRCSVRLVSSGANTRYLLNCWSGILGNTFNELPRD